MTEKFFAYSAVLVVRLFDLSLNLDTVLIVVDGALLMNLHNSSLTCYVRAILIQLAFHNTWSSAISAGCGVLVALLYWSNMSPLQRFRVPGQRLFTVSESSDYIERYTPECITSMHQW